MSIPGPIAGQTPDRTARPEADVALVYGTPRARWVLAATILGSGIVTLDASVVSIALPPIARTFHAGIATLQWVVTGYALTLASLLLLGGALGDRLGRRRIFLIGAVWFTIASAACGIAPNPTALVVARVVQGIGGALMVPASLAILEASFRKEDRSQAIGLWSGFTGVAVVAGPLVGGYLISVSSWRLVFFINVPLVAVLVVVSLRHVPETRDEGVTGSLDIAGALCGVVALAGLTYGLIEGPSLSWCDGRVVASLAAAAVASVAFVLVERRVASPLVPLSMFRVAQFSAANGVTFLVYGALGGAFFLLPVDLQLVDHYTPLESGIATLPMTVMMFVLSARSGALAARIGPRLQMSVGPIVLGGGLLLFRLAAANGDYLTHVLPAVLVFGAGLVITVAPLTTTALGAAPSERAGVASAVNNVVSRSAGLLAVAVLPVVSGVVGARALDPTTLASGFRTALLYAAVACTAGGIAASWTMKNPEASSGPAGADS